MLIWCILLAVALFLSWRIYERMMLEKIKKKVASEMKKKMDVHIEKVDFSKYAASKKKDTPIPPEVEKLVEQMNEGIKKIVNVTKEDEQWEGEYKMKEEYLQEILRRFLQSEIDRLPKEEKKEAEKDKKEA